MPHERGSGVSDTAIDRWLTEHCKIRRVA